jgi:hypothetical protein
MKNIIPIIVLCFKFSFLLSQSTTKSDISDSIKKLNDAPAASPNMIVSYRTLDLFFAKKIAFYLSGSKDLSLFNNYAVLDFGDDKAKIGWNINVSKHGSPRISNVFTVGLQAAVAKNFATLFSSKKLNNDIGVDLKYSHIFRGSIWFDRNVQIQRLFTGPPKTKPQKILMNEKRVLITESLKLDSARLWADYDKYIAALKKEYPAADFIETEEKGKAEAIKKKILKSYFENELEQLEDPENEAYNKSFAQWISINSFIPVTKTTYFGTSDLNQAPLDLITRKWNFAFNYNMLKEYKRNKLFLNGGIVIFKNNNADAGIMEELNLEKYKLISTVADTSTIATLSSDQIYFGNYETFWTPSVKGQLVFYPSWSQRLGIDLSLVKKFGKDQALDFVLGFPIMLTGQNEDSPVNIILQLKMPDINNKNEPEKTLKEKIQIGFTVGLPFNSILK